MCTFKEQTQIVQWPILNSSFLFNRSSLFDNESLQIELWTTLYSLMEETFGAFLFTSEQSCRFILKFKAEDNSYLFYLYKKKKINFPYGGDLHKNYQTSQKILSFLLRKKLLPRVESFPQGHNTTNDPFWFICTKKVQLELLIIPHSLFIQSTLWWWWWWWNEIDSYLCEWIFKQKCKLFWGLSYSDLNSTFASSEESSLREINEWIEGKTIEWELSRQGREKICFSFSNRQTYTHLHILGVVVW